ncbi:hypothetical protein AQUCO_05100029v1 [Aquilegia coerulea]|uniref:Uncharacterized protein n=1 Tax=Aquilegia coerulea TaxID=218851 RepID=A0A2G5CIU8_AQUCA|nr:hypothetical protein AQUCO_05100029v1 [Aquilegia coerulea]
MQQRMMDMRDGQEQQLIVGDKENVNSKKICSTPLLLKEYTQLRTYEDDILFLKAPSKLKQTGPFIESLLLGKVIPMKDIISEFAISMGRSEEI